MAVVDLAQPDFGSVPDWLSGVGSVLALVFAAIAAIVAYRAFQLQQAQTEKIWERERLAHADQVAAWMTGSQDNLVCVIRNASQLPVQIVNVYLSIWFGPPDRSRGFAGWYRLQAGVVPPGERNYPIPGLSIFNFNLVAEADYVKTGIFMVDSSGEAWRRIYTGELVNLDPDRYAELIERIPPGLWLKTADSATDPDVIVGEPVQ